MKHIFSTLLTELLVLTVILGLCACSETAGDTTSQMATTTTTATATTTTAAAAADTSHTVDTAAVAVTDTSGNAITSGSATVSFEGTSKTISAAYLLDGVDVEITSGAYASASDSSDEVVFLVVNGGSLTIRGSADTYVGISKTGSAASGGQVNDDYNFYGINSGIVVAGSGSSATIEYASISTDANGANAVVATADATVTISNSEIATTGNAGSRGLHATYGGTINADGVSISTQGASSATLATDRGGGTVNASNMTLETNSAGSPLVYSTGTINVTDSAGTANAAQMVVVEGGSSASVIRCDFACSGGGNRTGTSESDGTSHVIDAGGIFIYQSFSGDASEGTDYFTAIDSTFTVTTAGVPMFYVTNITAEIDLTGNTFQSASNTDYFLIAEETDQWGSTGSNGGKATLTLTNQSLEGKAVFVGTSSSSLTVTATDGSSTAVTKTTGTW
ncbi:MAG: hypothetical protein IKI63_06185 [Clostridia bacterium]|nr:hypothetical protein [Clostridia bacterium]